jgi:hypothetical protein
MVTVTIDLTRGDTVRFMTVFDKQHRTIGTYVAELHRAGFDLLELIECGPTAQQIDLASNWKTERDRPPFLLVASERR